MRWTIFIVLLMVTFSCNEKLLEKPEDLIGKGKMVEILYDLALLNSAQNTNAAILQEHQIEIMPYIYEKYSVDSVQFAQSDLYYASIPEEYEAIYKEIVARFDTIKKEMEDIRSVSQDSLLKKGAGAAGNQQ